MRGQWHETYAYACMEGKEIELTLTSRHPFRYVTGPKQHSQNQLLKLLCSVSLPRHISDERGCSVYEQTFHSHKSQKLPTNNSTPSTSPSLPYLIAELHGCN